MVLIKCELSRAEQLSQAQRDEFSLPEKGLVMIETHSIEKTVIVNISDGLSNYIIGIVKKSPAQADEALKELAINTEPKGEVR